MPSLTLYIAQIPFLISVLFYLRLNHRAIFLPATLLYLNLFSIYRIGNLYWWSIFIYTFILLAFLSLKNAVKPKIRFPSRNKTEIHLIILFLLFAGFSIAINFVSILDGTLVALYRLTPIILLIIFQNLSHGKDHPVKFLPSDRFSVILLVFCLAGGMIDFFLFDKIADGIKSFPGNPHIFCAICLVFLLFLSLQFKPKHPLLYLAMAIMSLFLFIVADYKLGLISLVFSFFLTQFFANVITSGKNYFPALLGVFLIIPAVIFNFPLLLEYLPKKFQILFHFFGEIDTILNTHTVTLATLELPKGYIQIFTELFTSPIDYLFGVGPGNYCTNVALVKEKANAVNYCIQYQNRLVEMGYHGGTFQDRSNAIVNLIAEFGMVGTFIYFYTIFHILKKPITAYKVNLRDGLSTPKDEKLFKHYLFFVIFLIFQAPFLSVTESSLYILSLCTIFGAFWSRINRNPAP